MPKEIKSKMIFSTAMSWPEKLNDGKELSGSQWNPEKVHILHEEQPLSCFRMKQKGLRLKHAFGPRYNF